MITPLVRSMLVFLTIFVVYSGLIGSRIIAGGILYKDHFNIYGGLGKSALFASIVFLILAKKRNYVLKLKPWTVNCVGWLILSLVSYVGAIIATNQLLHGSDSIYLVAITHLLLLLSVAFASLGTFGLTNVKLLLNKYRREILSSLGLMFVFYGFLTLVYGLWQVLASIVLHSVKWLLDISGLATTIVLPRSLVLSKFGINIAEYCSGIESIALFTGLYAVIGALDWHRFDARKFILALPLALIILFGLNILRVYVLILAGYYINPNIAFNLFHTYAGMVFFIIYSAIFWKVSYKWMLRKP